MPKKPPAEKSSFVIVNDGNAISFTANGSVVAGINEAMTWMPAERRARLLERLNKTHTALLEKEAKRFAELPAKVRADLAENADYLA